MNIENDIHKALKDRKEFERKQDLWHRLRYRGVKRVNIPYEGAPNVTYPLADTMIEKIKPMFLQQIYGPQTVATFVSRKKQQDGLSKMAEQWFDYQLKQNSNFEKAIHSSIDEHLQDGFVVVKIRWDDKKDQLVLEGVDPLYIIVPWYSEHLQDLDWIVHVYKLSVDQYKRNKNYTNQSDEFIGQIRGNTTEDYGRLAKELDKQIREGITHTTNDNVIVLWEVYYRPIKDWQIRTISPMVGWDEPVRNEIPLSEAYGGQLPFVRLSCDLNESGWYSPRGVCEIAAKFQQALSKQWCNQLQWMDYNAQPDFKNTSGAPVNSQNFQRRPGGVLPPGIEPNRANEMPGDFVQQMQFVRALAEDRIQVPDLGSSEHLVGNPGLAGEVTATQVDAVMGQSNQGNDMRSRVFRLQMAEIYRMSWKLLVKNNAEDLTFLKDGNVTSLAKEALHLDYEIHPSGSADDWNTAAQAKKAFAAFQVLQMNPNIDLRSLTEWLLERVDVQLIRRVMSQAGDSISQTIQTLMQFAGKELQSGQQMQPDVAQLVLALGQINLQALQQRGDPRAAQMMQQIGPLAQILQQIASQPPAPPRPQNKPPSESIAIRLSDLDPNERAQALAMAGIQATPGATSATPPKRLTELTPNEREQALARQGIVPTKGASSKPEPKPPLRAI